MTSPRGGGATLELSVSETKQFALPAGMNEMKVPPVLAEYLTDPAWMAICGEMKEQQWQRNTAAQIGAAFSQRLNTAYAPLTFGCRMDQSSEWNHYHKYNEVHYYFKLTISTESTMTVAIPAEVGPFHYSSMSMVHNNQSQSTTSNTTTSTSTSTSDRLHDQSWKCRREPAAATDSSNSKGNHNSHSLTFFKLQAPKTVPW
jgi:hypothetical protein